MGINTKTSKNSYKNKRKGRQKEFVKNEIIKVAEKSFIDNGFDNTMIEHIAIKSGYSKATIYNYFSSKEEIFLGVLIKAFSLLIDTLDVFFQDKNNEKTLLSLGNAYLTYAENYPNYSKFYSTPQVKAITSSLRRKELEKQSLSPLELEFRKLQVKIGQQMSSIINESIKMTRNETNFNPMTLIIILSYLNPVIMELLQLDKQENKQYPSEGYVWILFTLLDKGLKYFDQ